MTMEASCFICAVNIEESTTIPPENIENLKQLLTRLCSLLCIESIASDDWDFLTSLRQSICCTKCYDLLRNVERVHDIIVKTERQLKIYLSQVETLVVKSEAQNAQVQKTWLWSSSCFELRRRLVKKANGPNGDADLPEIYVKEECTSREQTDDDCHLDDHFDDPLEQIDFHQKQFPRGNIVGNVPKNEELAEHIISDNILVKDEPEEIIDNIQIPTISSQKNHVKPKSKRPTKTIPTSCAKKQKIEIPDGSDGEESVNCNSRRRTSTRVAKKSAEKALKKYASSGSDEDDDRSCDKDYYTNDRNDKNAPTETEASDDEDNDGSEHPKSKAKSKKQSSPKFKKGEFYPMVIAKENLFLFRWGTYVERTYTHLQCKAHGCNFKTEFDFYPSFQTIKTHIQKNHRNRRHRQKTPHPCLLCNTLFHTQDEFRKHIRKAHDQFGTHAKAICECCLMYTRHCYMRTHLFTHKNEEEKAAARATNDGSKRCFQLKESQMTEKKFVCDYENCTSSFKSSRNLSRHKQIHLPKELRTDQTLCPECGQQMLKECLATHMRRIHHPEMVDRVLICPICDKRYLPGDYAMLQKHIRQHTGDKPFLCTECGRSYVGSAELTAHVNQVHGDQTPSQCEWCDQVYTKYRSLQSHIKRKHPEKYVSKPSLKKKSKFYYKEEESKADFIGPIQRFPCPICETVCKYRSTLKKHMRLHDTSDGDVTKSVRATCPFGGKIDDSRTHGESSLSLEANNRREMDGNSFPGSSSMLLPIPNVQYFGH